MKASKIKNSAPILGHVGVGAGVACSATDNSFFCTLTKFTSAVTQILLLGFIFYMLYIYVWPIIKKSFSGKR